MFKKTKLFAALLGLSLMAAPALADAPVNDKLPDPDGKPADMSKPVKVFIIMGQSNTLEFGKVEGEQEGGLKKAIGEGMYPFLVDDAGNWTKRNDVRVTFTMGSGGPGKARVQRNDWLSVYGKKIGMDQGIGHQLGNHFDGPVLVLRSSIGNRGLGWDLLPPGSPSWEVEEKGKTMVYAGYGQSPAKWEKGTEPQPIGWKAGLQYDGDIARAKDVLAKIGEYYPGATEYEVAGFFWWQGCKDRGNPAYFNRYEKHLGFLIESLRKDFNAPDAKFVAASLGEDKKGVENGGGKILEAIMNIANAEKYPKYKGDVAGVYSHPLASPPGGSCGHYGGSAKTYMNVGLAMGEAMVELFKEEK
ncbi:MAG: sialate O-acetylesterase [Phycisphaeraceae bacterium]|jgi:hypothetical protein